MPDRARPRQRLLAGLAELGIIIAGVLIALWADQWWADRQDLRTQETYLAALDDDISETVGTLRSLMADFESWRDAAATLSGLGGRSADLPPKDVLFDLISRALFQIASLETRLAAYEDLKTTGRLGLIADAGLRRNLAQVDQMLQDIRSSESDLWESQHISVDPFLVARTDMVAVARAGDLADTRDNEEMRQLGLPTAADLIGEPVGLDPRTLLADPTFRGLLAFRLVLLTEALLRYRRLENLLLEIQGQIASARLAPGG